MSRRTLEIESLAEWDARTRRTPRLAGCFVQSLDLRERSFTGLDAAGAVFLGCEFAPRAEEALRAAGALIFPRPEGLPFDPYRGGLYSPGELYGAPDGAGRVDYPGTVDGRVYAWSRTRAAAGLGGTLAVALHDHAVTDALDEFTADYPATSLVGVMGGHAVERGHPDYWAAARLGARLTASGRLVVTGGGPGAMEAANLGAWMGGYSAADLAAAVGELAGVPSFRPSVAAWVNGAFRVRERWPDGRASLGIPTWFYGHEPPNAFATAVAKYFTNALREDTLLHRCRGGIVVLPGAAGTVQEIFQAATDSYYAPDAAAPAPIVLVGRAHWTSTLPAWPLLAHLAAGRAMEGRVHLVDTVDEAAAAILAGGPAA